jgi:hypothetical protein
MVLTYLSNPLAFAVGCWSDHGLEFEFMDARMAARQKIDCVDGSMASDVASVVVYLS